MVRVRLCYRSGPSWMGVHLRLCAHSGVCVLGFQFIRHGVLVLGGAVCAVNCVQSTVCSHLCAATCVKSATFVKSATCVKLATCVQSATVCSQPLCAVSHFQLCAATCVQAATFSCVQPLVCSQPVCSQLCKCLPQPRVCAG